MTKEATARIKINRLLEAGGWRFFADGQHPANIRLEPTVSIKRDDLDALGADFEKTSKGFIDFLLLNEKDFPFIVLEAKAEDKNPLIGKEQARRYLPISFKTKSEQDYIKFLWDAFKTNYESGKYEFASLAFHLMYMSFVSFSLWQIRLAREKEFRHALIGFQLETENGLLAADSPFKFYDRLKESQIFRFLKVIGCGNEQVGEFSKFVKRRNKIAHPSGTVFFNDQQAIDGEIVEIMREVANIQAHMRPVILDVYGNFLRDSADPEEREYGTPMEEIEASLIHRNYMSQKDIEICLGFDIALLRTEASFPGIEALHQSLRQMYAGEVVAVVA